MVCTCPVGSGDVGKEVGGDMGKKDREKVNGVGKTAFFL